MLQVQRLVARDGLQQEAALARVRAQMPLADKLKLADIKVDNSGAQLLIC
jgi:dephospho-CoA kinase